MNSTILRSALPSLNDWPKRLMSMLGEKLSQSTVDDFPLDSGEAALSAAFDDYVGGYFSTPRRKGLLHQLIYLAQFGDGIQVVQGNKGSGKSTFARELKNGTTNTEYVGLVHVEEEASSASVLADILAELGVRITPDATEGEAMAALRHFSQTLISERRHAVLIIDDAHRLEDLALAAIASIRQGDETAGSGLHLVFFSEPGLALRLDAAELIDVPAHDFDMPLFSSEELAEFFKYRLQEQGCTAPFPFAADMMRSFWAQSGGSPGIALALAREYSDSVDKPKAIMALPLPIGHLAALCLLVGVLVWALVMRDSSEAENHIKPLALDPPLAEADSSNIVAETPPATVEKNTGHIVAVVPAEPMDASSVVVVQEEPPPNNATVEDSATVETSSAKVEQSPARNDPLVSDAMLRALEEEESVTATEVVTDEAESLLNEMAEESASLEEEQGAIENTIPPPASAEPTLPEVSIAAPILGSNSPPSNPLSDMESKLMAAPPERYTLQVIAASSKPALEKFMSRQSNRDELFLYRGEREGKRWYIVVAGLYASRQAALAAISTLPPAQKSAGPWPKRIETIQQEITLIHDN